MVDMYDSIEQQVMQAIREVGVKCRGEESNFVWTMALKNHLWTLGKKLELSTCAAGCDEREWLFDLCWCAGPNDECLTACPLVLESEWRNPPSKNANDYYIDIRYDFQKLLLARAEHRIMVFEQWNDVAFEGVVARLTQHIPAFGRTTRGDRYLFACWLQHDQRFQFRQYVA